MTALLTTLIVHGVIGSVDAVIKAVVVAFAPAGLSLQSSTIGRVRPTAASHSMFQLISCGLFEHYLYIFSREMAVNLTTLSLTRGINSGLWVCPRWPSRRVQVEENVLFGLQRIQEKLPVEIELILTRGYEPQLSRIGFARTLFRSVGVGLFSTLYPNRSNEISDIFGSNGHDIDGTHIDISFRINGCRIRMLPLGVFTPLAWQQSRTRKYAHSFSLVCDALRREGFKIHRNPTEALQIHCDMIKEAD